MSFINTKVVIFESYLFMSNQFLWGGGCVPLSGYFLRKYAATPSSLRRMTDILRFEKIIFENFRV